jgi:hypothetical protein
MDDDAAHFLRGHPSMKAQFHKNQRVYVKTVGTWALIEKVMPQWAKGLDEPLRIFYDVGLGREFAAEELQCETFPTGATSDASEQWRLTRSRNKWKPAEECAHHPYPGTHPQIVTGETDWGGWRVPGAEYDLYPERIERQARMIVYAPKMFALLQALVEQTRDEPENVPDDVAALAQEAKAITRYVEQDAPQ